MASIKSVGPLTAHFLQVGRSVWSRLLWPAATSKPTDRYRPSIVVSAGHVALSAQRGGVLPGGVSAVQRSGPATVNAARL